MSVEFALSWIQQGRRALVFLTLGFTAWVGAASAQAPDPFSGRIDEVVAVVEDRPVMRSEIDEQLGVLAAQFQIDATDTTAVNGLRRDILRRIIDDELLFLEAKAQGVSLSPEELDGAVEQAIQDNVRALGGSENFERELSREGLTMEMLRARFREEAEKQGMTSRMVQREISPKVLISEEDVTAFYEENRADIPKKPRAVHLQDLFLAVRPDTVVEQRTFDRAQTIRAEIVGGLDFAEAARLHSDDPTGETDGGLLPDKIERGQLNPGLEAIAFALPRDVVSEPVRTAFGWNLLKVEEKDTAGDWVRLRMILFAVNSSRSDVARAEARGRDLRERVVSGELDFVEAIRTFSDDDVSRQNDGDLGWIPVQGFPPEVGAAIAGLTAGQISEPVPGDNGYHIFRILEEEPERDFEFNEIQKEIRDLAFQNQMEIELRKWLDQLEQKHFVERRAAWSK